MSDKFDHIIRDHVDAHEYDVDPQEIWDGIHQKTQKKRRGFWVWPLGGLSVLLVVSTLLIVAGGSREQQVLRMHQAELYPKSIELSSSVQTVITNEEKATLVNPAAKQTIMVESTDTRIAKNKEAPQISKTTLLEKNQNFNPSNSLAPTSFLSKSGLRSQFIKVTNKEIKFDAPAIEVLIPMAQLSTRSIDIPSSQKVEYNIDNSKYTELTKPLASSNWALTLTSGYSLLESTLVSNAAEPVIVDLINQSEKPAFAFNNEFLVHYSLNKNFKLSSGLSCQKVTTLFDWNGVLLTDGQGEVLSVYDETVGLPSGLTSLYYESIDRTIKNYNQSYFIDLPVNIAYAFMQWKVRPTFSLGAAFNVYNSNNGFRLSKEGIPLRIEDIELAPKVGARYNAALALEYPISPTFAAYGTVGGSTRLIEEQDLKIRYRWIDFNIGLKYRL